MRFECYRNRVGAVQRMGALRVACAYRTVSRAATLVVAGTIPIHLQAMERRAIYLDRAIGKNEARREARANTMLAWQTEWNVCEVGKWTKRPIPRLTPWIDRKSTTT